MLIVMVNSSPTLGVAEAGLIVKFQGGLSVNTVLPTLGALFKSPSYTAVMAATPALESVYTVEQVPFEREQTDWLKLPVLLLVLQVTVPAGVFPDTMAVHTIGEPMETGLGVHTTNVEDGVGGRDMISHQVRK
jgi:hypothetical protein